MVAWPNTGWSRKDFSTSPAGLLNWVAPRLPSSLASHALALGYSVSDIRVSACLGRTLSGFPRSASPSTPPLSNA